MPPECGNCNYNCCCTCRDPGCALCKQRPGQGRRCGGAHHGSAYRQKYACFGCRLGWKARDTHPTNQEMRKGAPTDKAGVWYFIAPRRCPQCGATAAKVPSNARCPSPRDGAAWELFRRLQLGEGLVPKKNRLSSLWIRGVASAMHRPPPVKKLMAMPTHLRDYGAWVARMNTTSIPAA